MNLHFLGGAMEIGGSCIYLRIANKGILLDSGIRQSASKDPLPDFRTIQTEGGLDAIFISHAHMDHIGTLPIISKAYPHARIYMTAMTADLTRVLLYDSLKIMNCQEDEIPHYSEQDVLAMLGRIYPIGYQTPFPVFDQFTLTFYPAGHIAGAACIYLVTQEGSLFYSGDFSAFSQRTIEGIRIPKLRPDIVITEATYGTRLHANRQIEEKRLIELVKECILEKKKILIPAFALGRAQEVLLILRAAIQNQEIPAIPIYVDGMIREINTMYARNPTYLKNALGKRILKGNEPFYTKEIQPVSTIQSQKREALLSGSDPIILLSSSGMLTGGPSAQYAQLLAPLENACIIITGYQDEESPGHQLLNLLENPEEKTLTLHNTTVPVRCRIEQIGLSAHGDKSEITALVERLSARHIFFVHGNRDVIEELGKELAAEDYRRQIYLPECGQNHEILLHTRRKQTSFQPAYIMQKTDPFTKENEKQLWDYWQEYYPGKAFSVSQIAYIWYGKSILPSDSTLSPLEESPTSPSSFEESILQQMQHILLESNYFSPNIRRLFLFEANTPEEVKEALAPKELTIQELEKQVQTFFSEFPYRKISYYCDRKEVLLQFDYPDAQDKNRFQNAATLFTAETNWTIQISPSINHNVATLFLSTLFGNRLFKFSYYPEKKTYTITLDNSQNLSSKNKTASIDSLPLSDTEAVEKFQSTTGLFLIVNAINEQPTVTEKTQTEITNRSVFSESKAPHTFLPTNPAVEQVEQNIAFFCIDQSFDELPHKPDKKSLKRDAKGSYLELSFISPTIGIRYQDTLQTISNQTGWRIHIADKINQNELFRIAQILCIKYEIPLLKNPSYLPEEKTIQLKIREQNEEILKNITEEFLSLTGCHCIFQRIL